VWFFSAQWFDELSGNRETGLSQKNWTLCAVTAENVLPMRTVATAHERPKHGNQKP